MKAMILAAGLGQRMRPLTDHLPKPLLPVGGKPLLQYHLEALQQAGVDEVIINLAYLGEKIREFVIKKIWADLKIHFSQEPEPLETGGAIFKALPLLGEAPFLLINGDVWSDYSLANLSQHSLSEKYQGHLVLVPNPAFHPGGDFSMGEDGVIVDEPRLMSPSVDSLTTSLPNSLPKYTFAGISLLRPQIITNYPKAREKFPLVEALHYARAQGQLTAEVYRGLWSDVGTPERLWDLDAQLSKMER